jgi:hypothetical protein
MPGTLRDPVLSNGGAPISARRRNVGDTERKTATTICQSALERDPPSASKRGSDAILVQLRLFRTDEPCLKQWPAAGFSDTMLS